ncbi:Glycosyltransferase family 1 protein [Candidatus Trichorickettsia mobilis]|uniref:Glycosyltransferase family 1 protein n=1 Tax=Candidatus Trichorickettsia mobilis TaxID=1346319 RepID=A0ABZ0UVC7_9RICK|nr:glycosyltransferase [Candidatus Trichorickettsia mobilis]WPY01135.1 Glycosyltransferase family 1 protein [Candidatus Trichorickettsia mobilis]
MARILFSLFSNINWLDDSKIDPFYEGFINSLNKHGNEVVLLRTNNFLSDAISNSLFDYINGNHLKDVISKFDPEFIITANHHIPEIILKNTNCPVLIWNADSPVWYSSKDYIKHNIDRYKFIYHGWDDAHVKVCQEIFGAKANQNFCVGYATTVQSKALPIDANIKFVGTIGYPYNMTNYLKHRCNNVELENLYHVYKKIRELPFDFVEANFSNTTLKVSDYFYTLTSNNRIKTLDALADMGLKVHGYPNNFFDVVPYSMDLAFCFDYTPIISMADTENVFNSTKIGVNLYHSQAVTGFSWRVADIMASNACLISPNKADLAKLSPYIKMPTFETPEEARELCKNLLKDEEWRKDIVAASQQAIEEHGRFEHMFKNLAEILGVNLLHNQVDNQKKYLIFLQSKDFIKPTHNIQFMALKQIQESTILRNIVIGLLRLIPKPIRRKAYYFLLSIKDHVAK